MTIAFIFAICSARVRLAEARSLSFLFRAEPPVRLFRSRITAAAWKMIDAAIARDLRAQRNPALDCAAGRHGGVLRKQLFADRPFIGLRAGGAQQACGADRDSPQLFG